MSRPEQHTSSPRTQFASQFEGYEDGWRHRLFVVIFEADTRLGRWFDFTLIAAIILSVTVVMLDSIQSVSAQHGSSLKVLEWFFTIAFTLEYLARLACVKQPLKYVRSFYGIVDLLAILPTYAAVLMPELHALVDLRLLRLLRMFRLLKLVSYVHEYSMLGQALMASRRKIIIFLSVVAIVVTLNGTLLYLIEGGPGTAFSSIPTSVYFAITSLTTVGFGDIVPQTDLGRAITAFTMLIGWSVLAVPTGIISSEMTAQRFLPKVNTRTCPSCLATGLDADAKFCKACGAELPAYQKEG
ncbi:MAG: ion transporter [Pusillimonas sp.]|jgi:voltage-gated potassium channel|nr:ion transporter [Pusillimonas sp.]